MMPKKSKTRYDAFLSHNSIEKSFVEALAAKLSAAGLRPFLDRWHLVPGELWQVGLERALAESRSFVACVGASGLGPWATEELQVALDRAASDASFVIIPVFLPGADPPGQAALPAFLKSRTWVDLRVGLEAEEGIGALIQALRRPKRALQLGPNRSAARKQALSSIKTLEERFFNSLSNNLAGSNLIERSETRHVHAALQEESIQVVVVHGAAGSGKSGVVYELARELSARGIPILPLRLDRYEPRGTPQKFGLSLELPDSPAKSLAAISGVEHGVLILDQLDALRWTSSHPSEAWDVCREVIAEALVSTSPLKVVVCCRTFDLDHDPQLRGWEQETRNLRRIEVQPLSPEEVTSAVQRAAEGRGGVPVLRPKEEELLRHVHHLQMWLAIYKSAESVHAFDTSWSLMAQFWANRLDELAKEGLAKEQAEEFERRLVRAVDSGAILTAPVRKLGMAQRELELYQRHNLLQVAASHLTFTFSHQSYQDYLVAKHLLSELDDCVSEEGGHRVITWLGSKDKQSLFRREQLRLLLGALRAEEHEAYTPTLRELLPMLQANSAGPIRFHLRLLVLQLLGQVSDPRPEEIQLVLALLDQPFWREHVLAEVVRGQAPWFEVLDNQGKLEAWLAGEDQHLRDSALEIMLYAVEKCGDRVARLLTPYLGKSADWTHRISWVLRSEPSQDSDALFELRLQLTKAGSYTADYVEWDKLAQSHPARFMRLAVFVLIALAARISRGENKRSGRRTELDWYGLEKVSSATILREYWATSWEMLFRAMCFVAQVRAYPGEPSHILESYAVDFETLEPILRLMKDVGRASLEDNWLAFVTLGQELSRADRRAEVLFLDSLVEGSARPELADWALGWLMADPWRAQLQLRRNSEVSTLASRLLERFAPVCSPKTYCRLEQWLLSYHEPDLLESYKRRREWIEQGGDLGYPNAFGKTPHWLLPKLPIERRSAEVNSRIEQLSRKFPPQADTDGDITKVGWVGSPLSEDARARMSDEGWIAIAINEKLPTRSGKMRFKGGDRIEEASVGTFATDFRGMTQRQPERFAMLAVRLPPTTNPAFINAILGGLAWPGDRSGLAQTEGWTPPGHMILEEVLALPTVQALVRSEHSEGAKSLCGILERYSEYPWSESAIDLLTWIAQQHSDPKRDFYPVIFRDEDSVKLDQLETNALNVTRGAAGFAIRSLLFTQPILFARLRPALEGLIHDEHPAVRVSALAACLPVINIDRDLAVSLFLECCEGPDAILGTREATDFLRYTYRTHLGNLRPLIQRMIACPLPTVATAGAVQVAAGFLVVGQLKEEFERCLDGTPPQRKGVAQVAASLLGEGEYAEKAKTTLLRLAEDEDKQVAQAVAHSFGQLDLLHITTDRDAWKAFARSRAFQSDPSPLLRALDRQAGKLLPFADCLLAVGTTFAEELAEAAQNRATGISADVRHLLPLLLRLYEQAQDLDQMLYLRCLDLWDRLLERRVGAAMGLTKELDRV